MAKCLITGGAGMVGRQLSRLLLERGDSVAVLDLAAASRLPPDIRNRVAVIRADLANWAEVVDGVRASAPDIIYHIGALMPPASEQAHATAYAVNVGGTVNVLEAARLFEIGTLVYSSTTATFSPSLPEDCPNDYPQMPVTMYGVTKVCSERLGEYYHRRYGVNFRAVRFLSILGPGRVPGFGWSAYTSLVVEECAKGNPYVLKVNRDLRLRFIYVKDAALSLMKLGDAPDAKLASRCYNLDGFSASTQEIETAVRSHVTNARISYEFDVDYQRVMDTQYGNIQRRMDDSLARRDWGWRSSYDLDRAVGDFVQNVRNGLT